MSRSSGGVLSPLLHRLSGDRLRLACLGLLLLLQATSPPRAFGQRWVLVYAGGINHRGHSVTNFERLLYAQVHSSIQRSLFDGIVCLDTHSPSGHNFLSWRPGPPEPRDYDAYLDTVLASGGALADVDSVVRAHSDTLLVVLMIPYPLGKVTHSPPGDSRIGFIARYLERAESLFAARNFRALRLKGFYWLPEDVSESDTAIVQHFTTMVHWHGLQALWIPYYVAKLARRWHNLGFDAAFLQPNYYMNDSLGPARLDSALARAATWGMGLEIEFDRRLLKQPQYRPRLSTYLSALETPAGRRLKGVAVYEGAGALRDLAGADDDNLRQFYKRVVEVLEQRQ